MSRSKAVYAFRYHLGETVVLFKRRVKERDYFLDFASCCARGKLDVETDGEYRHTSPAKAELDYLRYNDLESAGRQQRPLKRASWITRLASDNQSLREFISGFV